MPRKPTRLLQGDNNPLSPNCAHAPFDYDRASTNFRVRSNVHSVGSRWVNGVDPEKFNSSREYEAAFNEECVACAL